MRWAIRDKANSAQPLHRLLSLFGLAIVSLVALFALSLLTSTNATAAVHGPYTLLGDECASCHRVHTAKNRSVLKSVAPQSTLCFTCHDGTGSSLNVAAQYSSNPTLVNVPATRVYYSHDATVVSTHARSDFNEFGGVSNRHSECGDCHNSHNATGTASTTSTTGWSASGRMANVSGVSVVNGAAGAAPTYTFLNGINTPSTKEYQICFKCHSGFTTLQSNTGFSSSLFYLDKGIEFNPANPSYHPVEAAGKNATPRMGLSLSAAMNGTTVTRLWTGLTAASTIRCTQCHTAGTTAAAATDLPIHKSSNRGMLIRNFTDRVLKTSAAAYSDTDFALCFSCHTNVGFATTTATNTNFSFHNFHLASISGNPRSNPVTSTDINTASAGQGNAICSECHFRLHSTTYKDGTQTSSGSRLVNFSPNVIANGGVRRWVQSTVGTGTTASTGNCTLTCHGYAHSAKTY